MPTKKIRALMLAGGLVAWNGLVDPRLSGRRQPVVRAALGSGLVALARPALGLRRPALWSGLRWGLVVAGTVSAAVAATAGVPAVRTTMRQRELPAGPAGWLLLRIPFGTVWSEEVAFRGVLGPLAGDAFGPRGGRLLQAAAFGLSHIADARATGEPVLGTVVVTGAAGWVFAGLAERSGSLAAPLLAHLALNEAGALAVLALQRR